MVLDPDYGLALCLTLISNLRPFFLVLLLLLLLNTCQRCCAAPAFSWLVRFFFQENLIMYPYYDNMGDIQ